MLCVVLFLFEISRQDTCHTCRVACQTMAAAQAVRPQYNPEQRNYLFVEYVKNKGKRKFFDTVISAELKIKF